MCGRDIDFEVPDLSIEVCGINIPLIVLAIGPCSISDIDIGRHNSKADKTCCRLDGGATLCLDRYQ